MSLVVISIDRAEGSNLVKIVREKPMRTKLNLGSDVAELLAWLTGETARVDTDVAEEPW